MDILGHPRYKDNPVILFFEKFVLAAIGHLDADKETVLNNMNMQGIFQTQATEWKDVVREALLLSDTIEICALNEWIKLQEASDPISAEDFAKKFTDEYFRDDSELDVWTEDSFIEAIVRLETHVANADVYAANIAAAEEEAVEKSANTAA